jgi:2-keto-4-pentenoate hydratase/2-oxohepta-3-ene-1,7-dioic acid hydratase in catechol pathway
MRYVRFRADVDEVHVGVLVDHEIADLSAVDRSTFDDIARLLDEPGRTEVDRAMGGAPRVDRASVELVNPLPRPRVVFGVGLNYADHAAESGKPIPDFPVIFNKQVSCVTGPFDPIHHPRDSTMVDYEGELAFVIGRRCRHVPSGRGLEPIGGYTVMNDVSTRDWQSRSPTMTLGKSFDTHGPLGPAIVTADEVPDPHALVLSTWVNGELRQRSNTRELIFDCGRLVEILSTVCTLEPGDIVTTGTPAGVGRSMDPPRLLEIGDVVRIEIEGIGAIENEVVAEPTDDVVL